MPWIPSWNGLWHRVACVAILGISIAAPPSARAAGKHAAFVIDANTGAVISAQDADAPRYPASLTKMMTLYLVFEQLEQGRMTMATRIAITSEAAQTPPSKLGLEAGAEIAAGDAIKALIVKSANDVAVAIAQHIGGTEEKFARLMTVKARQLGMTATTFRNPHGLPDDAQTTTARDMVTLGLRLQDDFPKYFGLFATREFRFNGESHRNHNTLLFNYEGSEGIKTGYTRASGFNLVTSVRRGNRHVVGAVFGGASASSRNQTMRTLLNLALFKASPTKTRQPAAIAATKPLPRLHEPVRPALRPTSVAEVQNTAPITMAHKPVAADVRPTFAAPAAQVAERQDNVEVARVRSVTFVPRQRAEAPLPPLPAATFLPKQPQAQPPAQSIALADAAPARIAPPMLRPAITSTPTAEPARGTPPSTLQAQAEQLGRGNPPVNVASAPQSTYRLAGPGASAGSAYHVQIGAYVTAADADRQISSIRATAADVVGRFQAAAIPATVNGKAMFRARYVGLDAASAGALCTELRRRSIDCMVAKAE